MKGENAFAARFTVNLCLVDHGDLGKALVTLVLHNEGKCKDQSMPPVTKGRTNHNEEKGGSPQGLTDTASSDSADTQPQVSSWKWCHFWKKPGYSHSSGPRIPGLCQGTSAGPAVSQCSPAAALPAGWRHMEGAVSGSGGGAWVNMPCWIFRFLSLSHTSLTPSPSLHWHANVQPCRYIKHIIKTRFLSCR